MFRRMAAALTGQVFAFVCRDAGRALGSTWAVRHGHTLVAQPIGLDHPRIGEHAEHANPMIHEPVRHCLAHGLTEIDMSAVDPAASAIVLDRPRHRTAQPRPGRALLAELRPFALVGVEGTGAGRPVRTGPVAVIADADSGVIPVPLLNNSRSGNGGPRVRRAVESGGGEVDHA